MPISNPVVVVPGITASYLRDQYTLPPEIVWAVINKDYSRSALHPDNLKFEAREPARVLSDQVYEIAYKDLIEELRYNLRPAEDSPVPVYPFGYDWRHPLDVVEAQLAEFIEEVIERTKLMRNYHPDYAKRPKVNLVGHSMGGLVIAGYLDTYGDRGRVAKVATLASPFQGSFEAVIKVTTGTANLGTDPPSSREREAARITPALYHLLPSFKGGLKPDPGLPKSLFNPAIWQSTVAETIQEYIRLHGVDPKKRKADIKEQAERLFAGMLSAARKHRQRLDKLDLSKAGLRAKDWLCVAGVNATTRVQLKVKSVRGRPDFDFSSEDRQDHWMDEKDRKFTGDGTVPFEGAVPLFLPYESLVCVSPKDFGYWEIGDKAATHLAGFHGILPNMNMLHRLIVRHFTGRPDKRGNTWGRPAPGAESTWNPPIEKLKLKKTVG